MQRRRRRAGDDCRSHLTIAELPQQHLAAQRHAVTLHVAHSLTKDIRKHDTATPRWNVTSSSSSWNNSYHHATPLHPKKKMKVRVIISSWHILGSVEVGRDSRRCKSQQREGHLLLNPPSCWSFDADTSYDRATYQMTMTTVIYVVVLLRLMRWIIITIIINCSHA